MSNLVQELTAQNMWDTVGQGTALVDFWAPWCGPCRMQTPILDSIAQKSTNGTRIGKVNIDEYPEVAQRFGIQSIPTLVLLKNGQEVQRFVGVQSESTLLSALNLAQ